MFHRNWFLIAFYAIALLSGLPSFSAEITVTPSISVSEQYTDNVFIARIKEREDYITALSPSLSVTSRTEKGFFEALGTIEWRDYGKMDELDFLVQRYRVSGKYSFDPKLGAFGSFQMIRDYSPDRDLTETGIVTKPLRRNRYIGSVGIERTFLEKTRGDLSLDFERVEYARDPDYVDHNLYGGNLTVVHTMTPRLSGRLTIGYSFFEQKRIESDYYFAMVGIGYSIAERWNFYIDLGLHQIDTFLKITPFLEDKKKGTGWTGRGAVLFTGEKETMNITFYRRMTPGTGIRGVSERNFLSVDILHRFTYEFLAGLSGYYITNKAKKGEYALSNLDERVIQIGPRIRYNFRRNVFVEGSYSYAHVRDNVTRDSAKRNLIMLKFTISHPIERGM